MSRLVSFMLVSGVLFLAAACERSGEQPLPFAPEFAKPGTVSPVVVEFFGTISLFGDAPSDYLSESQAVGGSNLKRKISLNDAPFTLTLGYGSDDFAACDDEGERLGQVPGTRSGALGIYVNKGAFEDGESTFGVVVNFTATGDDGSEYLLTTGGGANRLDESDPDWTRVAKTDGYVRIKRDGERVGAICHGIVDFEFVVSR